MPPAMRPKPNPKDPQPSRKRDLEKMVDKMASDLAKIQMAVREEAKSKPSARPPPRG